jgi:hypothetical protein
MDVMTCSFKRSLNMVHLDYGIPEWGAVRMHHLLEVRFTHIQEEAASQGTGHCNCPTEVKG